MSFLANTVAARHTRRCPKLLLAPQVRPTPVAITVARLAKTHPAAPSLLLAQHEYVHEGIPNLSKVTKATYIVKRTTPQEGAKNRQDDRVALMRTDTQLTPKTKARQLEVGGLIAEH